VQRLALFDRQNNPVNLIEFSLPDLSGVVHNSKEWQGKILIINFWATWCPPCREEIPAFIALQNQYTADDVQFIGIALDEKASTVIDYSKIVTMNYPSLFAGDAGMAIARQLGNRFNVVPYTVVVDTQGKIVEQYAGEFSKNQLKAIIAPLLTNRLIRIKYGFTVISDLSKPTQR
jgi:thiol-disulfide isomerase/thioredoxin